MQRCVRGIALVTLLCVQVLFASAFAALSAPTSVSVSGLTPTSGTLQWEVTYAAAHDYDIIVSTQALSSSVLGNATTPTTVTAATPGVVVFAQQLALADVTDYALTGLTGGTHYYVYIRQNGTAQYQDHSAWVSYEFSTPCVATSVLPVVADFDGGNYLPSCWSAGAKTPRFSSATKHGDSGNSMMLAATAADGCFVYSPVFTGDAHAYYLKAYVYGVAGATYRIGVAAAEDLLSISPVAEATITVANTWTPIDVTMPADIRAELEQGIEYVWVIYNAAADGAETFYVDDVEIDELPTCIAPAGLNVTGVTSTSVSLAWNERGNATSWIVEYVSGTETLTAMATVNPFVLSDLLPNTVYTIRVKAACSATDESAWTQAVTVKTICGAVDVPFNETFDSYSAGTATTTTRPAAPVYPECWTILGESGSTSTYPQAFLTSNPSYNVSGNSFFVKMSSTTPLLAVLPAFDVPAATALEVAFCYRNEGTTDYNGHVQLGYVTNLADSASFVMLQEYARVTTLTQVEEAVTLPAGAMIAFRFNGGTGNNYYASIDNVVVRLAPSCFKPKNLHVDSATESEVKLAWTAGGDESSWLLTYKVGSGELQTVTVDGAPEYTITGLESGTSYTLSQLSLRAICSATDSSDLVTFSALTAKTLCGLVSVPYSYGFDATAFPGDCWEPSYHLAGTAGGWSRTTTASDLYNGAGAAKLADAASGNRNVIATPFFHSEAANTLRVSFWMKRVSDSFDKPIEGVRVWVNTIATDTLGGTPLIHVARSISRGGTGIMVPPVAAAGWYQYTVNIPVAGDVCILFEGISQYGNYSVIDEVTIEPVPSCERPLALTAAAVSANEVSVEIADNDSAHTAWEVVVGAVGFDPATATPIAVSSRNATVTVPFDMVGQTTYEVYVRTACSADDKSAWRGPVSFLYTDWSVFANGIRFTSLGQYPWTLSRLAGEYTAASGNQHIVSSVSDLVAYVDVEENTKTTVSFDWATSSYSLYEGFVIYIDEENPTYTNYDADFGKKAGSSNNYGVEGAYSVAFTTPGTHTIRFRHLYSGTYSSTSYGDSQTKLMNVTRRDVSCVEPSVFNMGTITSTSAVLNWNNTGADNWDVAVFDAAQSTVIAANALVNLTANGEPTATIEGLTPNTLYFAYVRSNCGANPSDWSKAVSFRTECAARTIPFAEGFETSGAELCWKTVGNAVTMVATNAAFDGFKALQVVNDSVAGLLVSPRLDAASLAEYEVGLAVNLAEVAYHGALKPLTIGVMTDPSDAGSYIDLGDIVIPSAGSWKEYRFSLADLASADYADWAGAQYIAISMSDSATYRFDAITVAPAASCPKPTALDVQPAGEDVVVTWVSDATAHYAEIALGDSVVFAGNVQTPLTPAGLEGNTIYKVRVRAICDADSSEWTPWLNFRTPCAFDVLPFSENFNSYTCPAASYTIASPVIPDCWQVLNAGSTVSVMSHATYSPTGTNALFFAGNKDVVVALPTIAADNHAVIFAVDYRMEGTGTTNGTFQLGYITVPGDTSSFVGLELATRVTSSTRLEAIIPAAAAVTPAIRYVAGTSTAYYTAIDNISLTEAPSCIKPSSMKMEEVGENSATIAWTVNGSETAWDLVYKLNNGAATTVHVENEPSFTITELVPGTSYTLTVVSLRAVCSDTESSDAATATLTFKTDCPPSASLPIEMNFANGISDCWTRYTSLQFTDTVSTANATPATGGWTKANTVFADGEVKLNIFGTGCKSWIVTPVFQPTANTVLSFDIALTKYGNTTAVTPGSQADDKFIVAVSTNGTTWYLANATVWSNAEGAANVYDAVSTTGDHITMPLGAYAGQNIRVAFYGESTLTGGDNDFHLSNIEIAEPAACDRPNSLAALNINSSSATIEITDPEGSAWEYVIDDPDAAPVAVTATSFTLTELSAQTNYTVYVRRVCGAGNVSAWRSVSFTTACGVIDLPYSQSFDATDFPGDCWAGSYHLAGTAGGWSRITSASDLYSGAGAAKLADAAAGNRNVIATPFFHSEAANTLRVSFWMKRVSDSFDKPIEGVRVWVNTTATDTLGGTPLIHVARSISRGGTGIMVPPVAAAGWYQYTVNIPVAGDVCILFEGISEYGNYSVIDEVTIEPVPSCEAPADLNVSGVTSSSISLKIADPDGAAWEYAVGSTDAPVAVTDTVFTVSELTPNTDYTVYLRRVCSDTDKSAWISVEVTTACEALDIPYAENFDSYTAGVSTSSTRPDAPVYPGCWTILGESGSSSSYPQAFLSSNSGYNVSGKSLFVKMSSTTPLVAVLPVLNTPAAAQVAVSFSYRNEGTSDSNGHVQLGYVTNPSDASSFVMVAEYARLTTMTAIEAALTLPAGAEIAFRFVGGSADNYYASIDNVVVEPLASCERPQGLSVVGTSATSVDVLITDTVSAHVNWEVVVVDKDANPTTGTPVAVSSKAATIPGTFVSGVPYDVYVRAVCGDDDMSNFRGPVTFKYIDYSTFAPAGTTVSCPSAYVWDLISDAGVIKSASTNSGVINEPCDMLVTINVPEGSEATLSFNYWVNSYNTASYGALYVYDNEEAPSTSNYMKQYLGGSYSDGYINAGQDNLKFYAGTHVVRFRYYKTTAYSYGEDRAKVWNLSLTTSAFFVPGNLAVENVTDASAKLTWTSGSDAVRNEVRFMSDDIDTIISTVNDYLDVTELTASTYYQFRVRSFAATTDSTAWSAAYRFRTPCAAVELPIYEDFDGLTLIPDCWSNEHVAGSSTTVWSVSTTGAANGKAAYLSSQSSGNKVQLTTPMFAVEAGKDYRVSFFMKHSSTSSSTSSYWNENLEVKAGNQQLAVIWNSYVHAGLTQYTNPEKHVLRWTAEEDAMISISFTQEFLGGNSVSLDEIRIEEVPDCEAPASVSLVGISASLVTAQITDLDADHSAWQLALCSQNDDVDDPSTLIVDADESLASIAPAAPLVSGNTYVLYARANCGEGSYSPWVSATFQFIDYSAMSNDLSFTSSTDYPWEVITDGTVSKAQNTNDAVSSTYSDLMTTVVVPAGQRAKLSFDYTVNAYPNMNYFVMYVDEANPTTSNYDSEFGRKMSTYTEDFSYSGLDETYTYTFTPVSGSHVLNLNEGTHTIRWRYYNNIADDSQSYDEWDDYDYDYYTVTQNYVYGDFGRHAQVYNLRYICTNHWAPDSLEAVAIGADTAVIAWNQCADAVKNQVLLGADTLETLVDNIVLRGLQPNTEYSLVVRSITATDTTAWSDQLVFRTDCSSLPLPYATGFEERDGGFACWTVRQTQAGTGSYGSEYGDESWQIATRTDSTTNSSSVHSGFASAQLRDMKAGVHSVLVSPELIIPEGSLASVTFWMYRTTGTSKPDEGVKVWANNADNLTGATALMHVTRCGGVAADALKVAPISADGWYQYEAVLPAGANRVIFEGISEWGAASYIDDVRISRVAKADTIFDSTCAGGDYEGFGFSIPANELTAGSHTYQYTKVASSDLEADSVMTLQLFVSMPSFQEFRDTICAHEHYTGYGFDIADVNPLRVEPYVRHLTNQFGCDSTVSLTLFVPQTEFAQTVHLCEGDSYTFGDSVVTTSGVYVHTYQSQYGCDSTVTLEIFFHATASAISASICSGETYAFGDQTLDAAGTYTATFQNAAGCDSVVTLTLNIIEPVVNYIDGVFCEGTAFAGGSISPKFMDLTVEGVYTDTLQSVLTGCDSILVLTLVEEKIQHTTVEGTYSEGKPFVYDGQSYQEAGTFEIVKTTVNGCDSIITLVVTKETGFDNLLIGDLHIAPNPVLVGEEAVIRTDIVFSSDYVLRVYDAVGRLVAETTEQTGRVPAMPVAGIYTVRIAAAGHHYQAKLIVK